jgi:hypothetical protein
MEVGETLTLTCTTQPPFNTYTRTWNSNNSSVSVSPTGSPAGTTALITANSVGSSTIRVQAGTATYSIQVTVTPNLQDPPTSIQINGGNRTIDVGETITLTTSVIPTGNLHTRTWNSSSPSFATVAGSTGTTPNGATATVTGVSGGTATISVSAGTATHSIQVTVRPNTNLPLKDPNDGNAYKPYWHLDPAEGDGYYANVFYPDLNAGPPLNRFFHNGSLHLEDIIADGNYNNVTATTIDSKYAAFTTVGADKHGKMSIIYSYVPTETEFKQLIGGLPDPSADFKIPVQVRLTRGIQTATITINMYYWECLMVASV